MAATSVASAATSVSGCICGAGQGVSGRLGKPATFEFRYHQANAGIRQAFFDVLRDELISLLVAVIHKQYAPADFRRLGRSGIYSHALAGLALRAPVKLTDYKLHLDGSGKQRQFLQGQKRKYGGRAAWRIVQNRVGRTSACWIRHTR